MVELKIGEAARMTGVSASTLRSWDGRYGLPVRHSAGGHRYFERELLLGIKDALAEGLSGAVAARRAVELWHSGRYEEPPADIASRLERIEGHLRGLRAGVWLLLDHAYRQNPGDRISPLRPMRSGTDD